MLGFVALCRQGMEKDLAAELAAFAEYWHFTPIIKASPKSGFVECLVDNIYLAENAYLQMLNITKFCFARQIFAICASPLKNLTDDRVTPILEALKQLLQKHSFIENFTEVFIEFPDTDVVEGLKSFCRSFYNPCKKALEKNNMLNSKSTNGYRLHLFFSSYSTVHIGISLLDCSSPWQSGIPRLKALADAPSRSSLKLEEAIFILLSKQEQQQFLQPNFSAVDLGAAPGGWTHQLIRRGMVVTAVDNAMLAEQLQNHPKVKHLQADGFTYRPSQPVEWMVCDMVEQPKKIIPLVARWLTKADCTYTIFNLKLPMQQKWNEVCLSIDLLQQKIVEAGMSTSKLTLRYKQLYHDRDEITCFASLQ